jgi:protein-S-isoprenylcysteine O-methyltransferase Ste14
MVENQADHANVKIDGQVLTLLHIGVAFLLDWLIPFPTVIQESVKWFGILLTLAGLTLGFMAVRRFSRANTTLDPHSSVTTVVTNGPYRFSRNPIYLGFVCTLIGIPLALGTYWGAVLSPVLILLMNNLVIGHEEAYLEKKFGSVYTNYKSRVRRWV